MHTYKVGDKVKIIGNTNGHNIPIGTLVAVTAVAQPHCVTVHSIYGNYNLNVSDIQSISVTRTQLKVEREKHLLEVDKIDDQLEYLEKTGLEQFDELQFKVYQSLKTLRSTDNLIEASIVIANIIKSN